VSAPLRQHPWDVPPLMAHYLRFWEKRSRKKTLGLTPDALRALVAHSWPGNVREIRTLCSKLTFHARPNARIDRATLLEVYPELHEAPEIGEQMMPQRFAPATTRFQKELILERVEQFDGDTQAARESLGLPGTTFRRYLRKLGLQHLAEG
jgi:two-component system C4-dicarboxylate transport response regulator DctD